VSRCDAGGTQLNGIRRKLGLRLLENRLAHTRISLLSRVKISFFCC
jgi:hypothetical protein